MDIVDRVTQWLLLRREERRTKVREFLVLVEDLCQALVDLEDGRSERAKFLQQKARVFYGEASTVVGGKLSADDLETVVVALGNARMYCWIRYLDASDGLEVDDFRLEFSSLIRRRSRSSGTLGHLLVNRLLASDRSSDSRHEALEHARRVCLRGMARVPTIRARF